MCGLVGVLTKKGGVDLDQLVAMRDTLRHRGPDDAGTWINSYRTVGLAHRRLAILDLTAAGHQPMVSACGRFHIIFNGEIYNYLELREKLRGYGHMFRTGTDTEVLLSAFAQWGDRCVDFLNGMFVFAIYDSERQRIFVARDRAGEKPLFYCHSNGMLMFASELKALLAAPGQRRQIDVESLDEYLGFGYVAGERCLLAGVRKLAPAHALAYDVCTDSLVSWRYWSLPEPCEGSKDISRRQCDAGHDRTYKEITDFGVTVRAADGLQRAAT
jgi:asparagine synthase (glutamine-hydrolysing)